MATLELIAHQKFTDPAIGHLLDDLRPYEESLPYDHDDASLIRVTRRLYERMSKSRRSSPPGSRVMGRNRTRCGQKRARPTISSVCSPTWKRLSTSAASWRIFSPATITLPTR